MRTLVASGGKHDLHLIKDFDGAFEEGQEGVLELELLYLPPFFDRVLRGFDQAMRSVGVGLTRDSEVEENKVRVYFRKGLAPLVLILGVIAGVLLLLLTSWGIYRIEGPGGLMGIYVVVIVVILGAVLAAAGASRLRGT